MPMMLVHIEGRYTFVHSKEPLVGAILMTTRDMTRGKMMRSLIKTLRAKPLVEGKKKDTKSEVDDMRELRGMMKAFRNQNQVLMHRITAKEREIVTPLSSVKVV